MLQPLNLPPELARRDADDRERWVVAAAHALITVSPPEVLFEMVARGEREFFRIAQAYFKGHLFSVDNYRTMFQIVKWKAAQLGLVHG